MNDWLNRDVSPAREVRDDFGRAAIAEQEFRGERAPPRDSSPIAAALSHQQAAVDALCNRTEQLIERLRPVTYAGPQPGGAVDQKPKAPTASALEEAITQQTDGIEAAYRRLGHLLDNLQL